MSTDMFADTELGELQAVAVRFLYHEADIVHAIDIFLIVDHDLDHAEP